MGLGRSELAHGQDQSEVESDPRVDRQAGHRGGRSEAVVRAVRDAQNDDPIPDPDDVIGRGRV